MTIKRKSIIQFMLMFLVVQLSFAQIKSISGTIRNAKTLEPLPYANLVIKGTYLGGTSNVDGYFYLSGLNHDSVEVVCSYMGYDTFNGLLHFDGETHIIIPIAMQAQTLGGEEVLVEDSLLIIPEVRVVSQIPEPEQPKNIVLKDSEGLEGEAFSYELSSPIQWLQPTGSFTNYLIDGVPVENSRHLYNVYPTFNLDAVKHIENHQAGNFNQAWTEQTNATELIYKEGNRTETDVRTMLGLVESGLTTSGPHPAGGSWYFSGRRVDFDAIYSLSTSQSDSVYRQFRPDYYFYDLNGKVTFDISDDTKVSGNMYLTFDKLHWLGDKARSAHSSWYNGFVSSRLQHRFSPRLVSQTNVYRKTYHSFLRADKIPGGRDTNLDGDFANSMSTLGITSHADYFLGRNNMIATAVSAELVNSELTFVDSSSSGSQSGLIVKAKAGYRYTLPYNLATDVGFQAVYSGFLEKMIINPSLLINWEPSNIYNAYFSLVQSSQMIREASLSNTLSQPLFDILAPVDQSLEVPEKLEISLGGRFMPIIGYDFTAKMFSTVLSNPTLMDSAWQGDLTTQSKWLSQYDKGSLNGVMLSIEKLTPGIRALAKYRFAKASITDLAGQKVSLPGHREHELYFILDGKLENKMGYRFDLAVASGKRYLGEDLSWAWSSPYHRVDASVYRDIDWEKINGRVSLKLLNITNRANLEFDESAWVTNSLQDRSFVLLPFTPTLNVEFVF